MEIWQLTAISVAVVAVAAGLFFWHVRQWRRAERSDIDKNELDFRRGQFRRRAQTTLMLGLATAALPFSLTIIERWHKPGIAYLAVVLILYAWAGLLALADIWAIHFFYGPERDKNRLEQTRLKAEIRRIQDAARREGNGSGGASNPANLNNGAGKRNGRPGPADH